MERYTVRFPESITKEDHAGRIETFLREQGIETAGVVVRWDDQGRATVTVNADRDPSKTLEAYTPTLTPDEQARADVLADAAAVVAAITEKPRQSRTDTEKVLLGLAFATDAPVFTPATPEEPIDGVWTPAGDEEPVKVR